MKDVKYYGFIWNEEKAKENKKKHDVSFEIAVHIFNDPYLCEFYDVDHSQSEDRYSYIGSVMGDLILFVIATDREGNIRIISARKATKKEREYYYENVKKLQSI